jgi:hypothetical protein
VSDISASSGPVGDGAAFVLGGPLRVRVRSRTTAAIAIVLVVVAIPLRGLFIGVGSSMEEGFMLYFPERLRAGDVPNVDFLHLYGPVSLQVLAGWYEVLGTNLTTQRLFGLAQHLGVIFGMFALARPSGRRVAVVSALTATMLVLTPIGLSALAWEGGVALALWSLACGLRAMHTSGAIRVRAAVATGVLAGLALGFRPDLVLGLGLALVALLWRFHRSADGVDPPSTPGLARTFGWALGGLIVGSLPTFAHVAIAGLGPSIQGMLLDPVVELRPGRELPRPPSFDRIDGALQAVVEGPADAPAWPFPALAANHQLFAWFWAVIAVAIAVPLIAWWWARTERLGRTQVLFVAGMFGLGILPQALQRPDSTHLAWGSCVSFALLPCVVAELVARRTTLTRARVWIPAATVLAAAFLVVAPFYTYRSYVLNARISVGDRPGGFEVTRGDRNFYFGNASLQAASQAAIDQLSAELRPGERLLVGPADLSRTIYSDVAFYHLFPELDPATYFIEMDPGLADADGSGLAADVASADWLILTNFWTGWFEPNASIEFGGDEPNQVVAERFCLVGDFEDALVLLYRRCEDGDGVDPATIGIGAQRRADLEAELAERGLG